MSDFECKSVHMVRVDVSMCAPARVGLSTCVRMHEPFKCTQHPEVRIREVCI